MGSREPKGIERLSACGVMPYSLASAVKTCDDVLTLDSNIAGSTDSPISGRFYCLRNCWRGPGAAAVRLGCRNPGRLNWRQKRCDSERLPYGPRASETHQRRRNSCEPASKGGFNKNWQGHLSRACLSRDALRFTLEAKEIQRCGSSLLRNSTRLAWQTSAGGSRRICAEASSRRRHQARRPPLRQPPRPRPGRRRQNPRLGGGRRIASSLRPGPTRSPRFLRDG
jgi:hypothetical protein